MVFDNNNKKVIMHKIMFTHLIVSTLLCESIKRPESFSPSRSSNISPLRSSSFSNNGLSPRTSVRYSHTSCAPGHFRNLQEDDKNCRLVSLILFPFLQFRLMALVSINKLESKKSITG